MRDHLTAGAWADNAVPLHLLDKLGFRVIGHDLTHSVARRAETPGHLLRLDPANWRALETSWPFL